jgi:hypothetical protein
MIMATFPLHILVTKENTKIICSGGAINGKQ